MGIFEWIFGNRSKDTMGMEESRESLLETHEEELVLLDVLAAITRYVEVIVAAKESGRVLSTDEIVQLWQDIENKVQLAGDDIIFKEWRSYVDKSPTKGSFGPLRHLDNIKKRIVLLTE